MALHIILNAGVPKDKRKHYNVYNSSSNLMLVIPKNKLKRMRAINNAESSGDDHNIMNGDEEDSFHTDSDYD